VSPLTLLPLRVATTPPTSRPGISGNRPIQTPYMAVVTFPLYVIVVWPPYFGVGVQAEISKKKLLYTRLLVIFYAHMDIC
jgi:hypothetical protein